MGQKVATFDALTFAEVLGFHFLNMRLPLVQRRIGKKIKK